LTLHRPSNVDDLQTLKKLLQEVERGVAGKIIIFPVHPRTRKNFDLLASEFHFIRAVDPLSYLEFAYLLKYAAGVITDSGGVQEETTVLGIPCITLRSTTERPETITEGTNVLVDNDRDKLYEALNKILSGGWKSGKIPELWDGHAAERIVSVLGDFSRSL
jgi:UDP-N-acetylglucosamine 2-epimerase (non-hydrolysing)